MELAWGLMIVIYLFTAGVSAGAMLTSNLALLYGGQDFSRVSRWGAYLAPFPISLGLGLLVLDLGSPFNFYQLFLTLELTSPMSYGSWIILCFTIISCFYFYLWLPERWQILGKTEKLRQWQRHIAKLMPFLSIAVATYTGLLLNAAVRPLWNAPLLPILFLVSALSTGVAAVILVSTLSPWERAMHQELHVLTKADAGLIILECLIILIIVVMARLSSVSEISAVNSLLFGPYAWIFWFLIVGCGLIIPLLLELMELKDLIPVKWTWQITMSSSFLVLFGGFFVRYIITYAGQTSHWF
ncbi:formate-dependent nitrite reductase, membrane component [Desulfosporosinus orientis DSM 765]|uniref:Formate-dependent nitrite reductase, membrane component n=1 Tax=Desulfosporosinus orientis (strain ATCC 19365 / DSM 765 / NCIMB 8382 / VKM B-1628 / Singapore I) TaxID=768706 RepID=G7WII2_DESOD|nr:NrfD/PsrC family molybdoenzyme membrane anchor subunit [Desulfosporosinus orientis]AET69056.1 formate-dependent nitrite reductase, membrane component [Desulfosporosinus orientis DSM 765]